LVSALVSTVLVRWRRINGLILFVGPFTREERTHNWSGEACVLNQIVQSRPRKLHIIAIEVPLHHALAVVLPAVHQDAPSHLPTQRWFEVRFDPANSC
jgi:hypothetical protein